jgi:predicted outer membrane protein
MKQERFIRVRTSAMIGAVVAAVAVSLAIASACTPDDEMQGLGIPETALGTADVPAAALGDIAVTLTDENILALLDTSYDALIELGGLAASRARDPRVREIADEAQTRHVTMRQENLAIARQVKASRRLVDTDAIAGHHEVVERLRMQSGEPFDRAFLDRSIQVHSELLDEVREALEMDVTIPVRDHLERVAATLETDLTGMRELRAVMEADP